MQRSCEECRQVVAAGDEAELCCAACRGMFHAPCVRSKRRSKAWQCSKCLGKKPERGLLLAEAVNKIIQGDEDDLEELWDQIQAPPRSSAASSPSSTPREDPEEKTLSPNRSRATDNVGAIPLEPLEDDVPIRTNGVCSACGLTTIPEMHIMSCNTCHISTAHTLCMQNVNPSRWQCSNCLESIRDQGSRRNARQRIVRPDQVIIPLDEPLDDATVVLCDNCSGEFSMAHLGMREVPSGHWYCVHCDVTSHPDVMDVYQIDAQPANPTKPGRSTKKLAKQAQKRDVVIDLAVDDDSDGTAKASKPGRKRKRDISPATTEPIVARGKGGKRAPKEIVVPPPTTPRKQTTPTSATSKSKKTASKRPKVTKPATPPPPQSEEDEPEDDPLNEQVTRQPLRIVIPEPLTEKPKRIDDTKQLKALHLIVGRTVLVRLHEEEPWAIGEVIAFDPHRLLFRVDFKDASQQWLPLHVLPTAIGTNVNVFVQMTNDTWWPAQKMELNEVAKMLFPTGKEEMEALVLIYAPAFPSSYPTGDWPHDVCVWAPLASLRCFDMFLQQTSNDDPKWREAIQLAYQSNERYIAIVKDAHERLSRNIQKHFQDKRWIGKQVSIVNYDTHSTYTGWITKMEKTNYYWLETDHKANIMVQLPTPSLKSSSHNTCWSWICPLSYVELSMQWFLDPEVILDMKVSPEHPTPQPAPIVDLGLPKDETSPKCSMCLFPLSSGTLISCTKCNIATHKSCVSPPYQRFPFKDKGGAELIPDLELPYICADCRTCDGCGLDSIDQGSWFVFEARLARVYLCRACSVEYANKQYCPVCYKVYTSGFCADLLQCTSCELWAHCSCEPDPDPVYHQTTPKMNEMGSLAEFATVAAASLLEYTITLPDPNDVCPDDIPTDKLKRKWMDERFARGLLFDSKYDPRILAKYECASCRQARFYKLLHSLGAEDKYGLFSQPVTLDIAPTYFDVIKSPMDLSTMAKNVKERKYIHGLGADFRDHFELMCLNAVTFNSKERDFVIWREAWRYYNAGARLLRQLLPSAQLVPNGKYTENILAAAKRQLPTNSAIVAKEDSQSIAGGTNGVQLKNKSMDDVQSTPMHSPLPQSGHSTPAPAGIDDEKDAPSQASHSAPDSTIVVRSDMYNFQTELGSVPKPYSCMANVVATQSMAQAHILCWLDACIVCCSTGAHEKMIFCIDCGEAYHQFCLHPPLDLASNSLKSTKLQAFWRCPNCKVCELCGTNKEESKLLVCDVCERGCHTFCLAPKLHDVPSTGFVCGNCIDCDTCHKSQEMTTWSPSINVCMDCMDEATKESLVCCRKPRIRHPTGECNVCPGCQKKWSESETLIQCDGCQSWVHPACDNISEEILLSLTEDSEYYCPLCRKKQRKHLKAFRKAWNLQLNIALIQEKRLEISHLWQSQAAYRETMRQYDYWRQFAPVYLYILRLGEECLRALAGRRISFLVQPPTTGISEAMIPLALRQAASRYLRFKRYARGPRAAQRRQQRKKQHFFSVEGVEMNPKAIAHIVSEAIGAASFLACCTWLYGTKKVSKFTAGLLAQHDIPSTLGEALVEKNAVSVESEVASIKAEYSRRRQIRLEELEARKARENSTPAASAATPPTVAEAKHDTEKIEEPAEPPRKVLEPETPSDKELANMTLAQPLRNWSKWNALGLGEFSDPRMCGMCREYGDDEVSGRLIYADFDQWVHVNCVAWSSEVYEDGYGVLKMCQKARFRSRTNRCVVCNLNGATVGCHGLRCQLNYHFKCALGHLVFTKENQAFCTQHDHWRTFLKKSQERKRKRDEDQVARKRPKTEVVSSPTSENEVEIIGEASAVSVCLGDMVDEIVGSIEHRLDTPAQDPGRFLMAEHEPHAKAKRPSKAQLVKGMSYRVGALTVHALGSIEVGNSAFHTTSTLYPIGYRSTRIFWSAVTIQERCLYECEIIAKTLPSGAKQPVFQITPVDDMEHPIQGKTPNDAVNELRRRLIALYEAQHVFNTGWNPFSRRKTWFSYGLIGDHFFGLTIPVIGAALEALAMAPTCAIYDPVTNPQPYVFCHTLPTETMFDQARSDVSRQLSIREHAKRSSGSIRTDGYHGWQQSKQIKPLTKQRRVGLSKHVDEPVAGNGKPVVDLEQLPIAMQYRELRKRPFHERLEVRKSRIHGYGLFVKEVIAEGKMIVEYQGQAIRQKVADIREKRYEEMGIGSCYMFRLDTDTIVDATRTGNLARFINHSCEPKANARIITIDGNEKKIIIFAKQTLHVGDEVTYDYKFPIEDEAIRCDCGAANCIGRMN